MEFLFSCLARQLTSERSELEEKFHIYARPCIILYLSPLSLFLYPSISWVKNNPIVMRETASFFLCNVIVNICHACNKTALG